MANEDSALKGTGIIRPFDKLGRFSLPKSLRESYDLNADDMVCITMFKGGLAIEKLYQECIFCKAEDNLIRYCQVPVCRNCLEEIKQMNP